MSAAADAAGGALPARERPRLALGLAASLTIVALGAAAALLAVPARVAAPRLSGPYVVDLSPREGYQADLAGRGGRNHVALRVEAECEAYDAGYPAARAADALVAARVRDAVLRCAWRTTKAQLDREDGPDALRAAIAREVEPLLFPVHVGDPRDPRGADQPSGLRPGASIARATMRGSFHEHRIEVDARARTLALDDGPSVAFAGDERDLTLADARGRTVAVDVTALRAGFSGEVRVGVVGRVRGVLLPTFLTQ
jgi:hypothetical protein